MPVAAKARELLPLPPAGSVAMAIAAFLVSLGATGAYAAGARSSATASVTIVQPITVTTNSSLSFGRIQTRVGDAGTVTVAATLPAVRDAVGVKLLGGAAFYPASYSITGEPNWSYRVTLPTETSSSPGGFRVSAFTVWSANSGALLAAGVGQLNGGGGETLSVGATVTVPDGIRPSELIATFPITITYE
jgi:hypothetical protein